MKKSLIFSLLFLLLMAIALTNATDINAANPTIYGVHYFYSPTCPHCLNVAESGILENVSKMQNVLVIKHDVTQEPTLFFKYADIFQLANDKQTRVPILFIEYGNNVSYLMGDSQIIDNLESSINNFSGTQIPSVSTNPKKSITLGAIIIAALIDSINPCAFGVLIFLLICLLNMGSAKRALKAGLLYSLVVFITYFLAGWGLFSAIQSLSSVAYYIHVIAGLLVLFLGVTQFIDVYFPGKFISLRIPVKAKPLIERISQRATIPAIILLGVLVSLFELPCTGGVYIAILTTMSINKTFGVGYLLLYNLIFILPLILITLAIFKGTSPETLQRWTQHEKKWMKVASGIIMLALAAYILLNL